MAAQFSWVQKAIGTRKGRSVDLILASWEGEPSRADERRAGGADLPPGSLPLQATLVRAASQAARLRLRLPRPRAPIVTSTCGPSTAAGVRASASAIDSQPGGTDTPSDAGSSPASGSWHPKPESAPPPHLGQHRRRCP